MGPPTQQQNPQSVAVADGEPTLWVEMGKFFWAASRVSCLPALCLPWWEAVGEDGEDMEKF